MLLLRRENGMRQQADGRPGIMEVAPIGSEGEADDLLASFGEGRPRRVRGFGKPLVETYQADCQVSMVTKRKMAPRDKWGASDARLDWRPFARQHEAQ